MWEWWGLWECDSSYENLSQDKNKKETERLPPQPPPL